MKYKVYYFWNTNQEELLKDYFIPTFLKYNDKDFILEGVRFNEGYGHTDYGTYGYKQLIVERVEKLIQILKSNRMDEFFIMSDIDIQFFGSIKDIIDQTIKFDLDMVFQSETPKDTIVNCGFMLIKTTEETIRFWEDILNKLLTYPKTLFIHDQNVANNILKEDPNIIKWGRFDSRIWAWSYGNITKNILLHHANCSSGLEDKKKQLIHVRSYMFNT